MITLNNEEYLSVKETIELLSISKMTLWRWVKLGKIKARKLSKRKIFFLKSDIKGMLD